MPKATPGFPEVTKLNTNDVWNIGLPAAVPLLRDERLSVIGREIEFVVGVILVSVSVL